MGIFGKPGLEALGPTGDFGSIPFLPSPNFSGRGVTMVDKMIWHYTAGITTDGAVAWLRNRNGRASAHFVIGRDGKISQLVKLENAAWHAGESNVKNANQSSIGVELVSPGYLEKKPGGGWLTAVGQTWTPDVMPVELTLKFPGGTGKRGWWVAYTDAQVSAMLRLVGLIEGTKYRPATQDMRGHEDIAMPEGRKTDPGPLFPWTLFAGRCPRHLTKVIESRGVV